MSGRIETFDSRKEQTSKWSQNEAFSVREAGVDIGKSGGQGGSNVSVDQVVTSGREVAGVTVDGNRTAILVPNEGTFVQSDWNENDPSEDAYIKNKPNLATVATSGSYDDLSNKPDLSIYISDPDYTHTDNNFTDGYKGVIDGLDTALAGKVDKVTGKGLSDNNFTNAQKDKLTNLANIYGIGSNLTLDPETNILSANAQPITIDDEMSSSSTNAVQNRVITSALGDKVDKVAGKVLSDNNFSNADKMKLDGIDQGAEVNDISTISVNGSQVTPSIGKNVDITVPAKVSDLTNDSGFVANTVDNLVNYYLKSETYTQSEVDSLISSIVTLDIQAVATLPTTDISTTTIYLVPSSDPGTHNVKDEYINTTGDSTGWELIGSTEIDLTGYVTDAELTTALADYVTTAAMSTALAAKLDISDVDQTYNPLSERPQSGVAVAAAVAGSGGGGLLPHLIIISEDGESEVKAVKGSTEIIATRTSAGHYECDVPEFGTWTIHAVLNGDDAQVNLVVDTVKVYTVDDSHWHADITVTFPHSLGVTCSCSKEGTTTLYATESPYTFTVHEAGTYTITTEYDGNEVSETISVSTNGEQKSMIAPAGADALPVNDINLWLFFAGIDNSESTYSSLADILADDDALIALMISNEAVDYLVRSTSWASSIVASEDAMKAIGANDYASETLLSNPTWAEAIISSAYVDYIANVQNPNMTSNTAPSGQCIGNSTYSGYEWYKAFDGNDATYGIAASSATTGSGHYLGYLFPNNVNISCVHVHLDGPNTTYKLQDSSDGETWNDASDNVVTEDNHTFLLSGSYKGVRAYKVSSSTTRNFAIYEMDIYGRENGGVQTWLRKAGITDKTYTTLSEVLADSTTLSALMASQSAVDYLVTCKGWASTICANQSAMTYIGLNNYCADTLIADTTWLRAIYTSSYKESVLNFKVPQMTSDNTPSGLVVYSSQYGTNYAWHAFNDTAGIWASQASSVQYCGYDFGEPVNIVAFEFAGDWTGSALRIKDYEIIGSDDGTNWNIITSGTAQNANITQGDILVSSSHYQYYAIRINTTYDVSYKSLSKLQFYGREDV